MHFLDACEVTLNMQHELNQNILKVSGLLFLIFQIELKARGLAQFFTNHDPQLKFMRSNETVSSTQIKN